ncbi:MAG: YlxR family protein [Dehalococcoidales bacterium]|nr:YlxR family protein [Dehalococcoidales bacterium]
MRRQNINRHTLPQRTCVACHQVKPKPELIRLVRLSTGEVIVDIEGKKAGRGAYLCPKLECWEQGLSGNQLEYRLHTTLTPENRERLMEYAKHRLGESASGKNK